MRWFRLVIELLCYAGFVFVMSGVAAITYVMSRDACPRFDTGRISCKTLLDSQIAEYAMGVTLISVFTGVPLLLALGAIGFVIWRLLRRADLRKQQRRDQASGA